jgi:hypothetical protein
MQDRFNFEVADRAISLTLDRFNDENVDETLKIAKRIYDFLMGSSCHFVDKDKPSSF